MRCERCGKELTNRIIKINGVTYCENCARLMGYDRFLRDPSDLMGNPFAPLDQIASSLMQMIFRRSLKRLMSSENFCIVVRKTPPLVRPCR